jgi:hypothetical protein
VSPFNVRVIQNLFFLNLLSSITGAGWFVIMLFWVEVVYLLINRLLLLETRNKDYLQLVLLIVVGFVDLKLCMDRMPSKKRLYLFVPRTTWYLQFYHMGECFACIGKSMSNNDDPCIPV